MMATIAATAGCITIANSIHEPKVLFLDEPTRGLDPLIVREFRETLREIHQRGATIVMNSHVLSEIEMLANRIAIIEMISTLPEVGLSKPRKQYMAVDLPAPFWPTRAKKSPSRTSSVRPLSACTLRRRERVRK
jgi:ABC-type uncharacterized transport system ATPase subunit